MVHPLDFPEIAPLGFPEIRPPPRFGAEKKREMTSDHLDVPGTVGRPKPMKKWRF